jgi:deoxyribonuclease V
MNLPKPLHRWDVTPAQAVAIQRRLAARIVSVKPRSAFRYVAGLDAAFTSDGRWCVAAVVVWDADERRAVERQLAKRRLAFPYVPGLLSFREAPALLATLSKVWHTPDVLICDGQGFAHPRRFGIACHVGLLAGIPSLGCAKSILVGEHGPLGSRRGLAVPLMDRGERVGTVLRTRDGVKPVYVSIGHRIDLTTAEELVLKCAAGFRLPEPTRLADHIVGLATHGEGPSIEERDPSSLRSSG